MANALYHAADGVIFLNPTDAGPTSFNKVPVRSVIISGPTPGAFKIRLNNTEFDFWTTTDHLTKQFEIRIAVNEVELVAAPANSYVYLLLDQMP